MHSGVFAGFISSYPYVVWAAGNKELKLAGNRKTLHGLCSTMRGHTHL